MPVGAQVDELAVEIDADGTAHTDDHRLSLKGLKTLVEVSNDVPGDEFQSLFGADNCFLLSPLRLELLLALDLLAFGGLLKVRVNLRPLFLV